MVLQSQKTSKPFQIHQISIAITSARRKTTRDPNGQHKDLGIQPGIELVRYTLVNPPSVGRCALKVPEEARPAICSIY